MEFNLTDEMIRSMRTIPLLGAKATGATASFIISIEKTVDITSVNRGVIGQLDFDVVTNFTDKAERYTLGMETVEDSDYNFELKNRNGTGDVAIGGYGFIYTAGEYVTGESTGEKYRDNHFDGQKDVTFNAAEIGTGEKTHNMVCEIVIDSDLHAGHWAGILQFTVKNESGDTG